MDRRWPADDHGGGAVPPNESARDRLDVRDARGAIGRDKYEPKERDFTT